MDEFRIIFKENLLWTRWEFFVRLLPLPTPLF